MEQTYTIGDPTGFTVKEYKLQNLTLSGQEHLKVVGPVVLVIDDDISGPLSLTVSPYPVM